MLLKIAILLEKNKFFAFFSLLFLAFSPLALFTVSILQLLRKQNFGIFSFSLFIFILSLLFQPSDTYDYVRHIERYYSMEEEFENFVVYYFLQRQSDFLFYLFIYIFKKIGINAVVTFGIFNFFTVFLITKLFTKVSSKSLGNRFIIFTLIFLFSISYISILSGVRFYLGLSFFLLFFYCIGNNKIWLSFLFLLLSIIIHFSFAPFLIFYVFNFFKKHSLLIKSLVLFSLSGIFFSFQDIFSFLISNIFDFNSSEYLNDYITNKLASKVNPISLFAKFFLIGPVFIWFFTRKRLSSYFVLLGVLIMILIFNLYNYVIFDRYFFAFILIILFILIDEKQISKINDLLLLFLLFASFLRFSVEIYDNRDVFISSYLNFNLIYLYDLVKIIQMDKY